MRLKQFLKKTAYKVDNVMKAHDAHQMHLKVKYCAKNKSCSVQFFKKYLKDLLIMSKYANISSKVE